MKPPSNAEWLRFVAHNSARAIKPPGEKLSRNHFAALAFAFYSHNRSHIAKLAIHKLLLTVSDGNNVHIYDLAEPNGHIPRESMTLPPAGNYEQVVSKAVLTRDDGNATNIGSKAQIVAYIEPGDDDFRSAAQAFCGYLVQQFISQSKDLTSTAVEKGWQEQERLSQKYAAGVMLPGTFAAKLVVHLARALSAKCCLFLIKGNETIFLEYGCNGGRSTSGYRPVICGGLPVRCTDVAEWATFEAQVLSSKQPAVVNSSRIVSETSKALKATGHAFDIENGKTLAVPVQYDAETVGVFLLGDIAAGMGLTRSATSLVQRAAEGFAPAARYLLQRRTGKMVIDPIYKSRETRVKRGTGFLIMPFGEPWSDGVAAIVKDVMQESGITMSRADEMHGHSINEDIWKAILSSEYIIADVTGRNANVYYELGVCHTVGKKTIILTQKIEDIPFDTKHLRHVVYSNDISGFNSIRKGIKGFLTS